MEQIDVAGSLPVEDPSERLAPSSSGNRADLNAPISKKLRQELASIAWLQNVQPSGVCTPWIASAKFTVVQRVVGAVAMCTGLGGSDDGAP